MIRNIIVALLFFFGPALLMMLLRNVFLFWQFKQRLKRRHPDIIDITPDHNPDMIDITPQQHQPTSPSRFFIASALTVGLVFAWLAWSQMHSLPPEGGVQYVPAHIDKQGKLVDGHYIQKP